MEVSPAAGFLPLWTRKSVWTTNKNLTRTTMSIKVCRLSWTASTRSWLSCTHTWTHTLRGALSSWWADLQASSKCWTASFILLTHSLKEFFEQLETHTSQVKDFRSSASRWLTTSEVIFIVTIPSKSHPCSWCVERVSLERTWVFKNPRVSFNLVESCLN